MSRMHHSPAFYRLLFEQNTLYRLSIAPSEGTTERVEEIAPSVAQPSVAQPGVAQPHPAQPNSAVRASVQRTTFPELRFPIVVVVNQPEVRTLPPDEEAFLDKILQAVGLSLRQIELINIAPLSVQERDAREVVASQKITHLLLFGVSVIELHLDVLLMPYQPKKLGESQLLWVDSLASIQNDQLLKRKLWESLKRSFDRS